MRLFIAWPVPEYSGAGKFLRACLQGLNNDCLFDWQSSYLPIYFFGKINN